MTGLNDWHRGGEMQKPAKLFLGILTLWPIVYVFLFIAFFFSAVLFGPGPAESGSGMQPAMAVLLILHLLTMVLILALTVFYIVDIFRNERVDKDKKVLWAVVIFMANAFAMPVYWYLYFWKQPSLASPSTPGQLNSANTASWTNAANAQRQPEQYVPPREPPNWRE
jgi:hypothetical protein